MSIQDSDPFVPDPLRFDFARRDVQELIGLLTTEVYLRRQASKALAGLGVWFGLLRDRLATVTPYVRERVPAHAGLDRRAWLLAPAAAAIGAATHVVWDSATHEGRLVVERVPFLQEELGPLPGYAWAQHLSTLVGTAVVATYIVVRLRSR